jgi:hypothetical protein
VSQSTLIFAIDPGTTESGWVLYRAGQVIDAGVHDNYDMLTWVKAGGADILAIEMIAAMGMAVGESTFTTVRWIGRFQQAWREPEAVRFILRRQVKSELCGTQQAKDGNIRQALIDRIGPQGVKAKPGPTYGVKSHAWQALGVAVTAEALGLQAQPRRIVQPLR